MIRRAALILALLVSSLAHAQLRPSIKVDLPLVKTGNTISCPACASTGGANVFSGHLTPSVDNTYDLGGAARWRNGNIIQINTDGIAISSCTLANSGSGNLLVGAGVFATTFFRGGTTTQSGAGAVPITHDTVKLTTTGAAQALTLADGADGQVLTIVHVVDGGSAVLTPSTALGFTTVTFTNVGDIVTMKYVTGSGWTIVGARGAAIA